MKFRELKRRILIESAYLHPVTIGISAGIVVLFGALFTTSLLHHPIGVYLPHALLPSFWYILFQLSAYAVFGAAFAVLLDAPPCACTPKRLSLQKTCGLLLAVSVLILSYVWIPLVCRAGSYFLGTLLCLVILLALFTLFLLICRISFISAGLFVLFAFWMIYILYLTLALLFFA